jgi:hypothetical protein
MASFLQEISDTGDDLRHNNAHAITEFATDLFGETGGNWWGAGLRFTLTGVPKDDVITNATITLKANGSESGTVCTVRINAEAIDDAAQISGDAAWHTAIGNPTTAFVDWTVPATTTNVLFSTPDISAIVQEIVDRPGWIAGQSINIFIDDSFGQVSDSGANRVFDDVNSETPVPATLAFDHNPLTDAVEKLVVVEHNIVLPRRTVMM